MQLNDLNKCCYICAYPKECNVAIVLTVYICYIYKHFVCFDEGFIVYTFISNVIHNTYIIMYNGYNILFFNNYNCTHT